ncbi:hypothetical protein C0214_20350 [Methylobacterium sp. DM1]|nr:hypothetical protein C0214_20350 [Methylobacterium sp. DM1]
MRPQEAAGVPSRGPRRRWQAGSVTPQGPAARRRPRRIPPRRRLSERGLCTFAVPVSVPEAIGTVVPRGLL